MPHSWTRSAIRRAGRSSSACCTGPLPVGELARDFPGQPAGDLAASARSSSTRISSSIVRSATAALYELNPAGVEALRAYFDRFWNHALAAVQARGGSQRRSDTSTTSED